MPYPARPVARDWDDLFITDRPAAVATEPEPDREERRRGFFRRMRENMRKTREALQAEVQATLFQGDLDEETWERLEEALIMADVGAPTTAEVVGKLEMEAEAGEVAAGEPLRERLIALLAQATRVGDARIDLREHPTVIMAVGVNGTGKTTTIGKLAWHLQRELGLSVLIAAADTYRAASSSAPRSSRASPRERASGMTYIRLISAASASSRLIPPPATGLPPA